MEYTSAIIVAAGKGSRMGAGLPKQFLKISGKTVLYKTLTVFGKTAQIDEIIIVIAEDYLDSKELHESLPSLLNDKQVKIVKGGNSRQESVSNGLANLDEKAQIVVVHDGVRPFIDTDIIAKNIRECRKKGAVLTAIPVTDTLKLVEGGYVRDTLDRNKIWQAQTPQTFKTSILKDCYQKAKKSGYVATDEAGLVEKYYQVFPIKGHKNNFKITHKEDLLLAKALYKEINQ